MAAQIPGTTFPSFFNVPKILEKMDRSTKIVLGILTAVGVVPGLVLYTSLYFYHKHHFTVGMSSGAPGKTATAATQIATGILPSTSPIVKEGAFSSSISREQPPAVQELLNILSHDDSNINAEQKKRFQTLALNDQATKDLYIHLDKENTLPHFVGAAKYLWYVARNKNPGDLETAQREFEQYMPALPKEIFGNFSLGVLVWRRLGSHLLPTPTAASSAIDTTYAKLIRANHLPAVKELLSILQPKGFISFEIQYAQTEASKQLAKKDEMTDLFNMIAVDPDEPVKEQNVILFLWRKAREKNLTNLSQAKDEFINYMDDLPQKIVSESKKKQVVNEILPQLIG